MEWLPGLGILALGASVMGARPLARRLRIRGYTRGRNLRSKHPVKKVTGDQKAGLRWGNAYLPESAAVQHTLVVGTTGSGKSQVQRLLMKEPLLRIGSDRDHRALIYDAKGETCAYLRRIGVTAPLFSLNPFEARSDWPHAVAWDIGKDIASPARSLNLAAALIKQERGGTNGYFTDAARLVVDGVVTSFMRHAGERWTLADLVSATASRTRLEQVLGRDSQGQLVIDSFLGDDRTGYAVASTVASKMRYYSTVAALWQRCDEKLSLRDWLQTGSVLLFGDNETASASLDVVNELMFTVLAEEIDLQGNSSDRRTWVWLDEVRLASGILNSGKLARLAVKGRSRGAALVISFQDIDGFRQVVGRETAGEIVAQCSNVALLRMAGEESALWASRVVGQYETIEVHHSDSTNFLRGGSRSEHRVVKDALLPSQFYAFPQTNRINGLHGVFLSTARGAELVRVAPADIKQVAVSADQEARDSVVVRPNADQWIRDWTSSDYERLGVEQPIESDDGRLERTRKLRLRRAELM